LPRTLPYTSNKRLISGSPGVGGNPFISSRLELKQCRLAHIDAIFIKRIYITAFLLSMQENNKAIEEIKTDLNPIFCIIQQAGIMNQNRV